MVTFQIDKNDVDRKKRQDVGSRSTGFPIRATRNDVGHISIQDFGSRRVRFPIGPNRNDVGGIGKQDVGSRSVRFPIGIARNEVSRIGLQDVGSRSTRLPIRDAGTFTRYKNGITTEPAEWPDNYNPFSFFEGFCTGFDYDPQEDDEDDPHRSKPDHNGKTRDRPNGGFAILSQDRATGRKRDRKSGGKTLANKRLGNKQAPSGQAIKRGCKCPDSDKENYWDASYCGAPFSSRPYGGNGGTTQMNPKRNKPGAHCIADPIMLPYSTMYYPAGPCGPRIQICPYIPLCCC